MGRFCWWVREWADFVGGYVSVLLSGIWQCDNVFVF